MKKIFGLLLSLHLLYNANAQTNTFIKLFDRDQPASTGGYSSHSLIQTKDTGYAFTRVDVDTGLAYDRFYVSLIKTTKAGDPDWKKKFILGYPDTATSLFTSLIQCNDSSYLIGSSICDSTGNASIALIKIDKHRSLLWSKRYPGEARSVVTEIKQTSDGGYIICGNTTDSSGNSFAFLFKTDLNGNYSWGKKYNRPGSPFAYFYGVTEYEGHGFFAGGYAGDKAILVNVDYGGNVIWKKEFLNGAYITGISASSDSNIVFTGAYPDSTSGYPLLFVAKINLTGNFTWFKSNYYTGPMYHGVSGWSIQEKPMEGYVFSAYFANPAPCTIISKLDFNGNIKWCKSYTTFHSFSNTPSSIEITTDGGYAFITDAGNNYGHHFTTAFVKTDSLGNAGCFSPNSPLTFISKTVSSADNINGSNCGTVFPVVLSSENTVATDTVFCENIQDPVFIGVHENQSETSSVLVYPNPFIHEITIDLKLPVHTGILSFELYDCRGIKIREILLKEYDQGSHIIRIPCAELPSGIYLYSLLLQDKKITGKIVKL